jgi:hypothetical protein
MKRSKAMIELGISWQELERINASSILEQYHFVRATYAESAKRYEINYFRSCPFRPKYRRKLRTCSGPDCAIYHTPTTVNFST